MSNMPIAPLDDRKQSILKAVVVDYVRTAEPVGSQSLLARHEFNVKSATIRNEMAELAELGYLCQPHTSAGRIPSDMGYRFYVDRLMDYVGIPAIQARQLRTRLLPRVSEIDMIIEQTCRILADLSQYATIATLPLVKDAVISHINLSNIGNKKVASGYCA